MTDPAIEAAQRAIESYGLLPNHVFYGPDGPMLVDGPCWLFSSWHNSAGYPYINVDGRDQPAHRVVFTLATGQKLDGRLSQAQTKCRKAGHDWTDPRNVRTRKNGRRYCAECDRQRCASYYSKESAC